MINVAILHIFITKNQYFITNYCCLSLIIGHSITAR